MTKTPDLTAPEAVERFFDPVECALDPQGSSAALRALSAALAEMTRRRDQWKGLAEGQDFTRVYLETCAERDALRAELADAVDFIQHVADGHPKDYSDNMDRARAFLATLQKRGEG